MATAEKPVLSKYKDRMDKAVGALKEIEDDQGTIGHLRGDIGGGGGRGMRGACALGFKRQRFSGSRVTQKR